MLEYLNALLGNQQDNMGTCPNNPFWMDQASANPSFLAQNAAVLAATSAGMLVSFGGIVAARAVKKARGAMAPVAAVEVAKTEEAPVAVVAVVAPVAVVAAPAPVTVQNWNGKGFPRRRG